MFSENEIRIAILHDTHKIFRSRHDISTQKLSSNADMLASKLSRPIVAIKKDTMSGEYLNKSFVFEKHNNEKNRREFEKYYIKEYLETKESTQTLHNKLLKDKVISNYNEITSMPYTSLKYHLLITTALHYNILMKNDFKDLYLNYTKDIIEPYSIIFNFNEHNFVINNDKKGSRIGYISTTNFGDTINRLYKLPFPEFIVENLKRIRSWSIGLQYLEDALTKLEGENML